MCEWEISSTLEKRPVRSSRIRGKNWEERKEARKERGRERRENKEGKQGVVDGNGGQILAAHVITQLVFGQLPSFLVAESSQNSFDYKYLIEKHGFS